MPRGYFGEFLKNIDVTESNAPNKITSIKCKKENFPISLIIGFNELPR